MGKNRTIDIHVKPNGNGYDFSIPNSNDTLTFNKNNDGMKKNEDYDVEFKLHNSQGSDLVFSKVTSKVLWAKIITDPDHPCPEQACYIPDVFYVNSAIPITDDTLSVINTDRKVEQFGFALNFVKKGEIEGPDTKYICYDPIGTNQNGGGE